MHSDEEKDGIVCAWSQGVLRANARATGTQPEARVHSHLINSRLMTHSYSGDGDGQTLVVRVSTDLQSLGLRDRCCGSECYSAPMKCEYECRAARRPSR